MKHSRTYLTLSVIWIILTYFPHSMGAIQCYKCSVANVNNYVNEIVRLCSDFDYSEKFIVDCPYSTFCVTKIYTAKLSSRINGTERDCANQKFETQKYMNGKWSPEVVIEQPYKVGCSTINDQGLRTGMTRECYCNQTLCNISGSSKAFAALIAVTAVISLMNTFFPM